MGRVHPNCRPLPTGATAKEEFHLGPFTLFVVPAPGCGHPVSGPARQGHPGRRHGPGQNPASHRCPERGSPIRCRARDLPGVARAQLGARDPDGRRQRRGGCNRRARSPGSQRALGGRQLRPARPARRTPARHPLGRRRYRRGALHKKCQPAHLAGAKDHRRGRQQARGTDGAAAGLSADRHADAEPPARPLQPAARDGSPPVPAAFCGLPDATAAPIATTTVG